MLEDYKPESLLQVFESKIVELILNISS